MIFFEDKIDTDNSIINQQISTLKNKVTKVKYTSFN